MGILALAGPGTILQESEGAEERCEDSFYQFIKNVCPDYPFTEHTENIIRILQSVADGDHKRLILQMPPRHYKSTTTSRLFPAYWLRRFPRQYVGLGSYGATLAEGFSRNARDYYQASGGTIDRSSAAVNQWSTGSRGGMWAVGVDGGATGKGFNLGIVDDPHKDRKESDSPAYRQRVRDWWDTVFYTRREPNAAIIVIHTRWHTEDLIGYLMAKEQDLIDNSQEDMCEGWHIADMAAIRESDAIVFPSTCTVEPDHRKIGEPLDPARIDLRELIKVRANLPAREWEALYQQRPTIAAGSIFFREWFRYYTDRPHNFARVLGSVDCTFKDSDGSDFVALTVWGQNADGLFLLALINQRLSFQGTLAMIQQQAQYWRWQELLVEDAANGPAVIDTLKSRSAGYAIRAVRPLGGKVARANAATIEFENGRVHFPKGAVWLRQMEEQLLGFPSASHDDIVDSITQAINYVRGSGPMRVATVSYSRGSGRPMTEQELYLAQMADEQRRNRY